MAWNLCSKADVISIHPTQESVLQDFWSDSVEAMIRRHVGNPNLGTIRAVANEAYSGDDSMILMVKQPPVISVEALRINGVPLQASDYLVIPNGIQLRYQVFSEGNLNVLVSYTSGTYLDSITGLGNIDPVTRLCAAAMIVAILQYRGRAGADSSIKWGSAEPKEGTNGPNMDIGMVDNLTTIMRRLLRRNSLRIR